MLLLYPLRQSLVSPVPLVKVPSVPLFRDVLPKHRQQPRAAVPLEIRRRPPPVSQNKSHFGRIEAMLLTPFSAASLRTARCKTLNALVPMSDRMRLAYLDHVPLQDTSACQLSFALRLQWGGSCSPIFLPLRLRPSTLPLYTLRCTPTQVSACALQRKSLHSPTFHTSSPSPS